MPVCAASDHSVCDLVASSDPFFVLWALFPAHLVLSPDPCSSCGVSLFDLQVMGASEISEDEEDQDDQETEGNFLGEIFAE